MNIKELSEKSNDELNLLLNRQKDALRVLRFKVSTANLKNVQEIGNTKKEVARILTIINSRKKFG